ncbi:unnamed protein product [Symbiodinium sp. KB8]|nr:unnamed protein product [Symbiodinium sp. KB8]
MSGLISLAKKRSGVSSENLEEDGWDDDWDSWSWDPASWDLSSWDASWDASWDPYSWDPAWGDGWGWEAWDETWDDEAPKKKKAKKKPDKAEKPPKAEQAEKPQKVEKPAKAAKAAKAVDFSFAAPFSGVVNALEPKTGNLLIECAAVSHQFGRPAMIQPNGNPMNAKVGSIITFRLSPRNELPIASDVVLNGFDKDVGYSFENIADDGADGSGFLKGKGPSPKGKGEKGKWDGDPAGT